MIVATQNILSTALFILVKYIIELYSTTAMLDCGYTKEFEYCKTLKFREHLIIAQIRERVPKGGRVRQCQLQIPITSMIMVRFG